MDVARVDPSGVDESAIGFRLAPRLNAAGPPLPRRRRPRAAADRRPRARPRRSPRSSTPSTRERRDVETRIRFEAEALLAEQSAPGAPAHVLAAEGWHPGVIGIVAARIAERHYRPTVLIALDGDEGSGSGRSIPGFDLLAGLTAGSDELLRYGGHRAAAGLTIAREPRRRVPRGVRHPRRRARSRPEDLVPRRADRRRRARRRAPPRAGRGARAPQAVRHGQPRPSPCSSPPPCSPTRARWGRAATSRSPSPPGGARSRCVRFGAGSSLPPSRTSQSTPPCGSRSTATTAPPSRALILRSAQRCAAPIDVIGEPGLEDRL